MTIYQTAIDISAPAETAWRMLTQEMPTRPEPYGILRFEGQMGANARIKLWAEIAPKRAFALKVAAFEAPRRMVWRGGMPFGLFTGTREFVLTPRAGGCHFEMREVFTGPMAGMITKSMPDLTPSFVKFAEALKADAEAA